MLIHLFAAQKTANAASPCTHERGYRNAPSTNPPWNKTPSIYPHFMTRLEELTDIE
ncbi:MAG: hypothetical protein ACI8RL_000201 [Cyclobacteriaceae bacterium]|jgi:hypothetical protein